jgi:subtilisin family serine protease
MVCSGSKADDDPPPRSVISRTGRGVRIAIVDSGVHPEHPHVRGVAGGVAILPDGTERGDYIDRLGHGTAVTAVIREKAPAAELLAIKVFDRALSTEVMALVHAIHWASRSDVRILNLSLGTARLEHRELLQTAVHTAAKAGVIIVAARDDQGVSWLPGSLEGVVSVQVDFNCPRDEHRWTRHDGDVVFQASGYPRPIPGVPPSHNLMGISFAVANMTGFAARALEGRPKASVTDLVELLTRGSQADDPWA